MTAALVDAVVIEMLALSEAQLIDRLVDLTVERDTYKQLAQTSVHALHDVVVERDRLRQQHSRLIAEYRALREHAMARDVRAA